MSCYILHQHFILCNTSQTYHQLSFIRTSPSPALCWKHLHVPADAPFSDHWVVDGGFHKREAQPVIFESELQGGDGLRETDRLLSTNNGHRVY